MVFEEKKILLKDGREAILKSPCVSDAEKMLAYIITSCGETEFLSRYPEEWSLTVAQEEAWVRRVREDPNTMTITCYVDGDIAGNCEINFRTEKKTAHRATVAIALLQAYWGLGIGSAMLAELIKEAERKNVQIVELDVVEGNTRALRLYEKIGFRKVSEKPNAFRLKDGSYRSDIQMQKYLK